MPNWYNQLCLLYSGCDFLMSTAICAMRCHVAVYFKRGCPLVHSCHYRLKQSCHRHLVCPTSLLRQSLSILITVGSLALYAAEFSSGSWLSQHLKSNRRTFFFICLLVATSTHHRVMTYGLLPLNSLCLALLFTEHHVWVAHSFSCYQDFMVNNTDSLPYYYCVMGKGRASSPILLPPHHGFWTWDWGQ